ncbi:hypothetical protein TWF569_009849 [Orbilia oligospora]|uniref:Actin-like ATPase domain-containing protein n=1 Tax=Orbilia oligospora TaxID=2813651 RepID=A0A7C8NIS2_ORBOL|nr:hypothetical protein TWF706_006644 [Orbilia oligospora]KAF3112692.1 hypothetical protein TWF102_004091 [Orbilia oligospora]KAF3117618.1 hypothetical protein TWF103_004303 [Orbilia oligospora]KAF3142862.1 hypothetical protein TWF703_000366 [Orbilia oligospora]KAF3155328.1 hypothetical protein TWF569_009849 [Orbilia oligospora]
MEKPRELEAQEREKLIVAVDFGTTYSGIAFCHSNQKELRDIEIITSWSNNGVAPKVPTEIRYVHGKDPLWGAEASLASERRGTANSAVIYNRFKLLLDPRSGTGLYNSADKSSDISTDDEIRLPDKKSAVSVSADYLRLLYQDLMQKILRRRLPETLDITPIHFIFSVPAIWSHEAQSATKFAAKQAGFCSRSSDRLTLVSEPEAAALYVLKAMHEANFSRISTTAVPPLAEGDTFVVCDAGGGTVDLISYEVEDVKPAFRLVEAAVGTGAKCGSSYIDEAFLQMLRQKIGPTFDDSRVWSQKKIGRGSTLMKTFDSIKRSFGQTTNDVWYIELPVNVEDDEENGIIENELEFTAENLKDLFDPVVDQVVGLIRNQVDSVQSCGKTVSAIFLVGGFGESHYLYQSVEKWAKTQNPPLTVINPQGSWSAIMRGAVIYALNPAIRSRRLRQHYGFECGVDFDPAKHDIEDSWMCPFGGGLQANGEVTWSGRMGQDCSENKEITFELYTSVRNRLQLINCGSTILYGSKRPTAPTFLKDNNVYVLGQVNADFSSLSLDTLPSAYLNESGNIVKYHKVKFTLKMSLQSADVKFSVWLNGKCVGEANIDYDGFI